MSRGTFLVATTTWNSEDLIELFLSHYQKLGVDHMLIMDFASSDATTQILGATAWRGFVTTVPFPGIARLDSSKVLLREARRRFEGEAWCLFCDPDELLVTPSMTMREFPGARQETVGCLTLPRFNVTATREDAARGDTLSALNGLIFRVDRRVTRTIPEDIHRPVLDPPWIFTDIPGKVAVRLGATTAIGAGDHSAESSPPGCGPVPAGTYLLHYPFRTYNAFREKIERARVDLGANAHLPLSHGWQIRRWIALAETSTLHREYLHQFVADEDLARLLNDGTLARDLCVSRFHDATDSRL